MCTLTNLSLVPITFHLRVPDDDSRSNSSAGSASGRREFELVPCSGLLAAQSQVEISVSLCSQTARKYHAELHVDADDIQQALLLLPITARRVDSTVCTAHELHCTELNPSPPGELYIIFYLLGSVAEWLACWTQVQKGLG